MRQLLPFLPSVAVLGVAIALPACSSTNDAPATPQVPCAVSLEKGSAFDLDLVGTGSCATRIRLSLRVATGSADAPTWTDASASKVRVEGEWQLRGSGAVRNVTLTNTGGEPVDVVGLEWATSENGVGLGVDRLLHNGYQSWSYTGVEALPESVPSARGTAKHGGDNEDVLGEVPGVSWWWSALMDASSSGVVVGADGGTVLKTFVAVERPGRMRIVQGTTGDKVTLAPRESRPLDGLFVALGDARERLEDYTRHVAAMHPPVVPRKPALGGYGSWNMYYANISAKDLRDEAKNAQSTLVPLELRDFLLDDGYETHWGSWAASPKFGAELATLTSEQSAAGLKPAIWLAPIYVDTVDPLVAEHPDWFVHTTDGKLRLYNNVGPNNAALDVTVPEARDYVVQAVQRLRTWGFRSLKLDFLFGGALEGVHKRPVTSLESYGLWMKTIREAVPDVHLVGCGAPMLPSVGWFDSMRIGPDIAFVTSPEVNYPFLSAEARHSSVRAHTDAFWALDPDVLVLRGRRIDDVEAWTTVVFTALAGGNYVLGDPRQSSELRRAMATDPDVLALTRDGIAARPVDLGANVDPKVFPSPLLMGNTDTAVPHVQKKTSRDGAHGALAVFGWELDDYAADVSLPEGARELVPPAEGRAKELRKVSGTMRVAVPRHGARLFLW